jgi:hypothetical protein
MERNIREYGMFLSIRAVLHQCEGAFVRRISSFAGFEICVHWCWSCMKNCFTSPLFGSCLADTMSILIELSLQQQEGPIFSKTRRNIPGSTNLSVTMDFHQQMPYGPLSMEIRSKVIAIRLVKEN